MALRLALAPYACDADASRGRLHAESASPTRSEFQRDRDRIIHCTAFRRLAHKDPGVRAARRAIISAPG